ncbi:hypothetical protein U9M48_031629 [Paspalum notatum var. saurae]|uniref:Protein FAR1-RELATED SEQUENCE n=1 Tax=Paspalum notatum var. saurae TaxID=547442 RepID=A0AAQ3U659_PASNO
MAKGNIVIAQGLFPITVEAGRGSISRVRNVSPCPGPDEATTETEAGAHRCGYPHGGVRLLQRPPPTTPCASSSDLPHDRGSPSPHGVVRPPLHPRSPASDCGGAIAHPSLGWGVVRHGQEGMAKLSAEPMLEYYDIVSKVFSSEEEGFQFYNRYALEKGFSVHKAYVEWDKGNEEICLRSLVCSREGFREAKYMNREERKRKPRNLSRVGCKAKLVIAKVDESGQWFVKDFIDEHNHPLAPKDLSCLLRSHRRISDEQKAEIVEMEIAGIRKHQIMDKLEIQYGGYDNVGFTSRDIYNFCYQYKQEMIDGGDAEAVISHFKAIQQRDPEFFFKYLVDGEGHLKGLFWADSQSRIDYKAFGDVVVFDSTYRTNRYNMPFVPFVGLNHHRSTVIFGCGIISHETSEAYEWMLWTFLLAMAQKHPISVITDGDLAMQRALRVVWPNCNHRLCVWHIGQNVIRNLHDEALKEDFKAFIFDCSSVEELERKWDKFLEKFEVNSESWLYQMYKMRKLWCAAYHVGHCFLGLTSNQRSESLNSRLHAHLDGKMTLIGMVQHYDQCLSDFRRKEANEDIVALQTVPFTEAYASAIEKDAARLFTPNVFAQVKFSIDAANNCIVSDVLDGCDIATYMVAKMDRREIRYNVTCEFKSDALFGISCSCRKLECFGTPSSFGNTKQESLSLSRWKTYMGERVIPMTLMNVHHLMGLPTDGQEVRLKEKQGNNISLVDLEHNIATSTTPDDDFIRQFVLFTIGIVLAPTANGYVDSKYLALVEDVAQISKFNWGQFTLSHLFHSIENFLKEDQVSLQGNLILLQVWYWEKVRAYSYHSVSYTPIPPPYMARWDDQNAKRRIEAYARDGLDGGTVDDSFSAQYDLQNKSDIQSNIGHEENNAACVTSMFPEPSAMEAQREAGRLDGHKERAGPQKMTNIQAEKAEIIPGVALQMILANQTDAFMNMSTQLKDTGIVGEDKKQEPAQEYETLVKTTTSAAAPTTEPSCENKTLQGETITQNIAKRKQIFTDDYDLVREDNEVIYFIRQSFEDVKVADVGDIVLTVRMLRPNVTDGYMYGQVYIPLNTYNMHWMLLVLNVKKKEIQVLNSIPDPIFRDETKEALLEADYLTNNSENNTAEESNADDDIQEISMQVAAKKNNQSTKAKRKRGRPRKVKSALDSTKEKFSTKTIEKQVQSTVAKDRHGIKRRAVIPGPHQKSPYKPF